MKPTLLKTTNYNLFTYSPINRPLSDTRKLTATMKIEGFQPAHPIQVESHGGALVIIDGQHRFEVAKSLGLPVYYVICEPMKISISDLNRAQRCWTLTDHVSSYATQGNPHYIFLLDFAKRSGIAIRAAASMMNGEMSNSNNVCAKIATGYFKVKTKEMAELIALIASETGKHVTWSRHQGYLGALCRCLLVPAFNAGDYVTRINRHPELLDFKHCKSDFLQMIEEIVNYRTSKKIPLAFLATQAASKRSAING